MGDRAGQLADRLDPRVVDDRRLRLDQTGLELLDVYRALHREPEVLHEHADQTLGQQLVGDRLRTVVRRHAERADRLAAPAEQRAARERVAAQVIVDHARHRHPIRRHRVALALDDVQRVGIGDVDHPALAEPVADRLARVARRDLRYLCGDVDAVDHRLQAHQHVGLLVQPGHPHRAEPEAHDLVDHRIDDLVEPGRGREPRRGPG
ncbi:MAG TPA: hypothetical protein VHW23_40560 [Kofleriaceae bacterium]|nr:hypothetical protein [Kofleriaceae bacterium]